MFTQSLAFFIKPFIFVRNGNGSLILLGQNGILLYLILAEKIIVVNFGFKALEFLPQLLMRCYLMQWIVDQKQHQTKSEQICIAQITS